jgi:hypothetical protein
MNLAQLPRFTPLVLILRPPELFCPSGSAAFLRARRARFLSTPDGIERRLHLLQFDGFHAFNTTIRRLVW